jgi:hypothetical protein
MSLIKKIIKDVDLNDLHNIQDIINFNVSALNSTEFIEFCNLIYNKKYTIDIIDNDLIDMSLTIIKNNVNWIRIFSFNLQLLLVYITNKFPLSEIQKADIELLEEDYENDSSLNNLWTQINELIKINY